MSRLNPIRGILALVVFAVPAAAVAIIVFAGLQATRIDVYAKTMMDLRPGPGRVLPPPSAIVPYSAWLHTAYDPESMAISPTPTYARILTLPVTRPRWVFQLVGRITGVFVAGALMVWGALVVLAGVQRVLPFQLSRIERCQTACGAMRASWRWSAGAAMLISAATWYISFDRRWGGTLEDGLVPRPTLAVYLVGGWCIITTCIAASFLRLGLARAYCASLGGGVFCRRCGYSMRGLSNTACPECAQRSPAALVVPAVDEHLVHRIVARRVGVALAGFLGVSALLIAVTASFSPRAWNWVRLRPGSWFDTPNCGWIAHEESQRWRTIYGDLTISGVFEAPTPQRPAGMWKVSWALAPSANSGIRPDSGEFPVRVTYRKHTGEYSLHERELPCGPIAFYSMSYPMAHDPRLHVVAPCLIFDDMGVWGRPIPAASSSQPPGANVLPG